MKNKKTLYGILLLLLLLSIILGSIIFYTNLLSALTVRFLDIGQGDSILISKGRNQILIDGGPSGKRELEKLGKYIPFWDRNIELVIATHPDSDHISGFPELAKNYKIKAVIQTGARSESATYETWQKAIEYERSQVVEGVGAEKIRIGEDFVLEIIAPMERYDGIEKESNETSIVAKLIFGKNKFLLVGDATSKNEKKWLDYGLDLRANILKVGHHGSKYSTSSDFLEKVSPQVAVISVGKNNYGHPNEDTLNRLKEKNIQIIRTDEAGDITYECENKDEACQLVLQ